MGLDITAYRKLETAPDADPDNYDYETVCRIYDGMETNFPGRITGVKPGLYHFANQFGFRAGSYGGYNVWRDQLAKLAGNTGAEQVWNRGVPGSAFYELINFSDCEGVIGPVVAAKLLRDFIEYEQRAEEFARANDDKYFLERYQHWKLAFEMAADGGAVDFH
jgi:hypothetical protein